MKEKLLLANQCASFAVVSKLFQEFEAMQLVYVLPTRISLQGCLASHEVDIRPTARLAVCLSSVIFVHCDQTVRETETADERNTLFLALTISAAELVN